MYRLWPIKHKNINFTKYQLPPPSNWTEFEDLCLKLWGILWEIPNEIDYNSSNSQGQDGVDIAAIPKGKFNYWGIQYKIKISI